MKEKIYTIPINEAFEGESFCPFCSILSNLEKESITYTVGPAMMEPDFRIITNEKGFCKRHIRELCSKSKALPLSLVFKTHLDSVSDIFENVCNEDTKKRQKIKDRQKFTEDMKKLKNSCAVCDRVNHTFERYIETFVYMLKKEDGFLEKALKSDGFCIEHFSMIASFARDNMSESEHEKLFVPVIKMQKERIDKYRQYIKNFSDSFDYRNIGKEIDAPKDVLLKAGFLQNGVFTPKAKDLEDI
ncbi:MAG: hypothetical protein E7394_03425 [Ruminococcaceae bacterium]|nr:hypothetical protein [Oscillospiraceae bacterium]